MAHVWSRTGRQRYKYRWRCSRCAKTKTRINNDKRPSSAGCSAQGGADPGRHRWGSATKTTQYESKCKKCAKKRWTSH